MSKPYSNKALPAGTVLREWRLEDVLGVGGFGIVYKGRGIYFDELVAIKEYFPSAISQRDEDDTVVPVDSDAEEVHALGLKKFVEEAKLLWNLSTPTRHPNIVNVRSLFEIHGTAYMVMDFEDGLSLSKMLRQGTKFNERSLWNIVQPIAEGLDRAHRVGVLHRDIKPPNILINDDGRPVLIDFGSARFEAAEATSTTVTFHTPPYAALEQYVKTYPQGPWTDIYALGVVLYECVTGKKPAEVLERMHGGKDEPLSGGKWPGYTKKFLAAIDAAMIIKPQERPQSINQWLDMFGTPAKKPKRAPAEPDGNEDATRVFTHEITNADIVPVAPPAGDYDEDEPVRTEVPAHPSAVEFKGAGQETGARRKVAKVPEKAAGEAADENELPIDERKEPDAKPGAAAAAITLDRKKDALGETRKAPSPLLIGVAAVALLATAGGAWMLFGRDGTNQDALAESQPIPVSTSGKVSLSMLAAATKALADDATKAGAPLAAVTSLAEASDQLTQQYESYQRLSNDPAQASALDQREAEMRQLATRATAEFTQALFRDTQAKAQRLASAVPWANPTREATGLPADRQQIAGELRTSLGQLRLAADAASKATTPAQAIDYARLALAQTQSFTTASLAAYNSKSDTAVAAVETPREVEAPRTAAPRTAAPTRAASQPTRAAPAEAAASSGTALSPGKINEINAIVADGRNMARDVIRMGRRGRDPQLKANADLARNYDQNLATLKDSARGISSDREADRLIAQAKQTRAYLQFLVKQSSGLN